MATQVGFRLDVTQWMRLAQRMADVGEAVGELEVVLSHAFEDTQEVVHVLSGSLRGSGKVKSSFNGHTWEGEIEYGGGSPGFPNDPVVYAEYERARGGSHDFMAGFDEYQGEFLEAMTRWLR